MMKDYLICIDSDGSAIDSMEIKHRLCFGPCIIKVFGLEEYSDELLNIWNEMNLYTMDRGINRFLGLEKMLITVNEKYKTIDNLDDYIRWCESTDEYSNRALSEEGVIFEKVLEWSNMVNKEIEKISMDIRPFEQFGAALRQIKEFADVAIVSSANKEAVNKEWTRFGFIRDVDYFMCQDKGTKAKCINELLNMGYKHNHVLMIGDAPGDELAAKENNILYYPILAGKENKSWNDLMSESLDVFIKNEWNEDYQKSLTDIFHHNLGGE